MRTLGISTILLLGSAALVAADSRAGAEFQVNSFTTNLQGRPAVGLDGAGGFVVAWVSDGSSGTDSDGVSIQAQRYDCGGSPVGGQFQVNTYTTSDQSFPAVSACCDGGFVVVWHSDGSSGTDSDSFSVQAQRYAASGAPEGPQFQVNTYTTQSQSAAAVAPNYGGGFVVTWTSYGSAGTDTHLSSVQAQRFASDGSPDGSQFQVNTGFLYSQRLSAVGGGRETGFVVTWEGIGSAIFGDHVTNDIFGQRYLVDGTPVGGEFRVNTYTVNSQRWTAVTHTSDGFVVAWDSDGFAGGTDLDGKVQAQRFGLDGTPLGGEFQVNTYTTSSQRYPSISGDGAGGFVVVWHSSGSHGTDSHLRSVQGQRFGADGLRVGREFQINVYTTNAQIFPSVSLAGDGFVATWQSDGSSGTDTDDYSIQARHYSTLIFQDGFEAGDTSAWSTVVP